MIDIIQQLNNVGIYDIKKDTIHKRWRGALDKHPNILNEVMQLTSFLPDDISLRERIYCIQHELSEEPKCKQCGGEVKFKQNLKIYSDFCSTKCMSNNTHIMLKKQKTCELKFGVLNPSQNNMIKDKKKKTLFVNYGTETLTSDIFTKKRNDTNMRRYGHTNPAASNIVKQKIKNTNLKKYGREYPGSVSLTDYQLLQLSDSDWLYDQHVIRKQHLKTIAAKLDVDPTTISNYFYKHSLPILNFAFSIQEKELLNKIKTLTKLQIFTNTRMIIPPLELDIVIPDAKLAIEYCGLYWHSEKFKQTNYHKNKFEQCKEKGYTLLTIFEDEWIHKQSFVISKISSLLQVNTQVIGARQCQSGSLSKQTRKEFMDLHHLQGDCRSTWDYGLTHNDQLIAVISLLQRTPGVYEIVRYCVKTGCMINGGFNKLLCAFEKEHEYTELITFADLRWSVGMLYINTGFTLDKVLPPDYRYIIGDNRLHKFGFRHNKLHNKLQEYDPNKTEHQNMLNANIMRIYDCGKYRFVKKWLTILTNCDIIPINNKIKMRSLC